MPHIRTVKELAAAVRIGKYADGGYPIYFLCADGGALAPATVKKNYKQIAQAVKEGSRGDSQWRVVAYDVNWEDPELYDADTNVRIPSAYAEDQAPKRAYKAKVKMVGKYPIVRSILRTR